MKTAVYSDEQLVQMIRKGGGERDAALRYIYTAWKVDNITMLQAYGASDAQAKQATHKALTMLDHAMLTEKQAGKGSLQNLFMQFCKKAFMSCASDAQLIRMIQDKGKSREVVFKYINDVWKIRAKKILLSKGGDMADIENAIQNAMVIFERKINDGTYKPTGKLEGYFIGICKLQHLSGKQGQSNTDLVADVQDFDHTDYTTPEDLMLSGELREIISRALKMLEPTCQEVLSLFSQHYSHKEIATELDLGNANNAAGWVFRCKNKLIKTIRQHPDLKNFFNDEA